MKRDLSAALTERVKTIVSEHSQSDIARKTGVLQSSISKYLKGQKMPLEFGSAVVTGLGVNPEWLLTGKGARYSVDISRATEQSAEQLLELIQAMDAALKKPVGSLSEKKHTFTLKRLNESLEEYERFREQLRVKFRPLYDKLLQDFQQATDAFELDRAQTLNSVLVQIVRFCDDSVLYRKFLDTSSYLAIAKGDGSQALALQRDRFLRDLFQEDLDAETILESAHDLCAGLFYSARIPEALKVCRAALAPFEYMRPRPTTYAGTALVLVALEISHGDLRQGMHRLIEIQPELRNLEFADFLVGTQIRASFLSRSHPWQALSSMGVGTHPPSTYSSGELLRIARWVEDPVFLGKALDILGNDGRFLYISAYCLYLALQRSTGGTVDKKAPDTDPVALFHTLKDASPDRTNQNAQEPLIVFIEKVVLSQILIACGKSKEARRTILLADKQFRAIPSHTLPDLLWRATHYRNILRLAGRPASKDRELQPLCKEAKTFFEFLVGRGYLCFEGTVEKAENFFIGLKSLTGR